VNELEEIAKLLRLKDELEKEVALMEEKYGEVLKDQEILVKILERLRTKNRRLMEGHEHGYGISQKS